MFRLSNRSFVLIVSLRRIATGAWKVDLVPLEGISAIYRYVSLLNQRLALLGPH